MIFNEINWRYGKISAYESIWSIIRKYSYLNRVSKTCSKSDILGQKYRVTEISAYYSNDYNISLLSRLIGKPKIDVQTAWLDHYVCKEHILRVNLNNISTHLRYCPECMLHGYHSPIHQLPWVIFCPIHNVRLEETCPNCKKHISLNSWIDPCHRTLYKDLTCDCGRELCPSFKTINWPDGWSKSVTRPIGSYLRWLKSLVVNPLAVAAQNGFNPLNLNNKNPKLLTELIFVLIELCPPPPSVSKFIGDFPLDRQLAFDFNFTASEADALIGLVNSIGYYGISNYFVSYHLKRKMRLPQFYCAKKLINKISRQHKNCLFRKINLKNKYAFSMFLGDSFNSIFEHFCPRHTLISAISNAWIGLLRSGRPQDFINCYSNVRKDFYDCLLVEIVETGLILSHKSPVNPDEYILSWHPEVYRLFSHITCIFWEATTSALCENYLKFGSDNNKNRRFLSTTNIEPKFPRILMLKIKDNKVRVVFFKRNNPIDSNKFYYIDWDAHVDDADGYFECLNNICVEDYHRRFTESVRLP